MHISDTPYRPHPSVVFTRLGGTEALLLHLETQRDYTLNETGLRIWGLLEEGRLPTEIVRLLHETYELTPNQAETAVAEFLQALQQAHLICPATT